MNKYFPIGCKVKYYPLLSNKEIFTEHEVLSDSWEVCGETVVKISDKAGGVSIEHLDFLFNDEQLKEMDDSYNLIHPDSDKIADNY